MTRTTRQEHTMTTTALAALIAAHTAGASAATVRQIEEDRDRGPLAAVRRTTARAVVAARSPRDGAA
ncbi:hypothetical protein Pam4_05 [Pseudanabaena phage Pam4]|nr:hypothetical protein Pam4_05 [Pseudanabaena phage Pam4]